MVKTANLSTDNNGKTFKKPKRVVYTNIFLFHNRGFSNNGGAPLLQATEALFIVRAPDFKDGFKNNITDSKLNFTIFRLIKTWRNVQNVFQSLT